MTKYPVITRKDVILTTYHRYYKKRCNIYITSSYYVKMTRLIVTRKDVVLTKYHLVIMR